MCYTSHRYYMAQHPQQSYSLEQIREQSWADPWFLFQAYVDIGRDRIIEAVRMAVELSVQIESFAMGMLPANAPRIFRWQLACFVRHAL